MFILTRLPFQLIDPGFSSNIHCAFARLAAVLKAPTNDVVVAIAASSVTDINLGSAIVAKIPRMITTATSSIIVKPLFLVLLFVKALTPEGRNIASGKIKTSIKVAQRMNPFRIYVVIHFIVPLWGNMRVVAENPPESSRYINIGAKKCASVIQNRL